MSKVCQVLAKFKNISKMSFAYQQCPVIGPHVTSLTLISCRNEFYDYSQVRRLDIYLNGSHKYAKQMREFIQQNTALVSLKLYPHFLKPSNMIIRAISHHTHLQTLSLTIHRNSEYMSLVHCVSQNQSLKTLNVLLQIPCDKPRVNFVKIIDVLKHNTTLKWIYFSHTMNNMSYNIPKLYECLSINKTIEIFSFYPNASDWTLLNQPHPLRWRLNPVH